MTGWRCGWAIGPAALIAAQMRIQSHATSNASSITQKAVLAALTGSQEPVRAMLDEYRVRRDRLYEWLTRRSAAEMPKAGRRLLHVRRRRRHARRSTACGRSTISPRRCSRRRSVAVTPGEAFDAPGFVRISYATSMENLREGSRRMLEFVAVREPRQSGRRRSRADRTAMAKVVAVIGASGDRKKFGNRAVRAFRQQGYTVMPINPHETEIEGLRAYGSVLDVPGPIDMATFYVPPEVGERVIDEIARRGLPRSG